VGFPRAAKRLESARQPRERALPRTMRARHRGSGLPMATKTADQISGEFPIARRPARLHPPEARTIATIPARTAWGRRCQAAASSATSGGITSASMRRNARVQRLDEGPPAPTPPKGREAVRLQVHLRSRGQLRARSPVRGRRGIPQEDQVPGLRRGGASLPEPTVANCRQLSPTVANCRQLSPTQTPRRVRSSARGTGGC